MISSLYLLLRDLAREKEIFVSTSMFTVLEKNYLKLGLSQLRQSIIRSIAKEANPDIVRLKNEDVKNIDALEAKIGAM